MTYVQNLMVMGDMTLRDYFASLAILPASDLIVSDYSQLAANAYAIADAMMKERERNEQAEVK